MQAPSLPQSSSKGKNGYYVALGGSALSILSFLVLPFLTNLPSINVNNMSVSNGSVTLLQVAQLAGIVVWLPFIIALIACVIGAMFSFRPVSPAVGGAVTLIVMGSIGTLLFFLLMAIIPSVVSTVTLGLAGGAGIGAWACLLGMIATLVGGIMAVTGRPRAVAPGVYGYAGMPQYPPQQVPNPNYPPQVRQQPQYLSQEVSNPNYPPQQ